MKILMRYALAPLMATGLLAGVLLAQGNRTDVRLVVDGASQAVIHVPPELMDEKAHARVAASVRDLAKYLEQISGATIEVATRPPSSDETRLAILIGQYAQQRFGGVKEPTRYKQGWRMVVSPRGIGLMGESDEAISYAIYEVLDRLGCRWYMPGKMGEVIPSSKTIALQEMDISSAPRTLYRGIWFADKDFMRRNRMGGLKIDAHHALERYITPKQRQEHPEWRATIDGKPSNKRLKWSNPAVANAIADAIIAKLNKKYQASISLSPEDGGRFDESPEDRALDAGDIDPTTNTPSITDRYLVLVNRIASRVNAKYPDVLFGCLSYVQYTRPPVREKPNPNLVMQIAPITYCRAHAMTDTELCPSRASLLPILQGWAKVSDHLSYYNYMYNLAEVSVPYPMMHQMSEELPLIYANHVVFWQPETLSNFESVLPGMWLSIRKSWDTSADPKAILDEFFARFYGAAEKPMRRYWQIFDDAWSKPPLHAGGAWSYAARFTPQVMKQARAAIDQAAATAQTPVVKQRVAMQEKALGQFERFMQMIWDLNEGRLDKLEATRTQWLKTQAALAEEYAENYAFTSSAWTRRTPLHSSTVAAFYFETFYAPPYREAAHIVREAKAISPPLRQWRYAVGPSPEQASASRDWSRPDFDDSSWKSTDVAVERWAALGLMNYIGPMTYRATVKAPPAGAGQKLCLWLPACEGRFEVFVNGRSVPCLDAQGKPQESATVSFNPLTFDITAAAKPGQQNQITIFCVRQAVNELGAAGLLAPPYIYCR